MRILPVLITLATVLVLPAPAVSQTGTPCWTRGDPGALELRASPFDSTAATLQAGRIKVCYSRPRMVGRPIMGRLVSWGAPWRFGANEATAIHVGSPATVAGVRVAPGWYSLVAIPGEEEWRIVVNAEARRWGVPISEEVRARDVGSGVVPVTESVGAVELFTLELVPTGDSSADLVMAWDRTRLRVPITLEPGREGPP